VTRTYRALSDAEMAEVRHIFSGKGADPHPELIRAYRPSLSHHDHDLSAYQPLVSPQWLDAWSRIVHAPTGFIEDVRWIHQRACETAACVDA